MVAFGQEFNYWFDFQSAPNAGLTSGSNFELDAGALSEGYHTLHFQIRGNDGSLSSPRSAHFIRGLDTQGSRANIFVDGVYFASTELADGINGYTELDASALTPGLHTISTQVVTSSGIVSSIRETLFLRLSTRAEIDGMTCWYTLDNETNTRSRGRVTGGALVADIDVNSLPEGIHRINFMLANADGLATQLHSAWFFKLALGGGKITDYHYWVNEDFASMTSVNIVDPTTPFVLAALVPLKSYPFSSNRYHFETSDNGSKAYVYSANDFNIMFRDARGNFAVQSHQYYDLSGRKEITHAELWEGATQATGTLGENMIKWYKFESRSGDSIAVRLDKAAMYELYAPDGTKLLARSGANSVKSGGAHTVQTGTHYLAVHDASIHSSVSVTLQIIDKYAVLDYSPKKFAPHDGVIIDLKGNGLNDIEKVEIKTPEKTYSPSYSGIYSWAYARFAFEFGQSNPISAGDYTLSVTFKDEEGTLSTIEKPIRIAEPKSGEMAVSVKTRNNTITNPRTISVTVRNGNNYGVCGVPVLTARTSTNPDAWFDNFNFVVSGDEADSVYVDTEDLLGRGVSGRYSEMIIPYIGPEESITFDYKLERIVDNNFEFFAWCGVPWSEEEVDENATEASRSGMAKAPSQVNGFNYTRLSHFQNGVSLGGQRIHRGRVISRNLNLSIAIGSALAGTELGLGQAVRKSERDAYGAAWDAYVGDENVPQYPIPNGMTPAAIASGAGLIPGCVPAGLNPFATNMPNNADKPEPAPKPRPVKFPQSLDPNDILGYIAPGGGTHIGSAVKELEYTIEFENDPEIATASALTVRITNSLDVRSLNPTTFRPLSLRLGRKTVDLSNHEANFVETVDMRPEINGLAQITCAFNQSTGKLNLLIESLNPYTLDQTDDIMRGFLPVNHNGSGIGEFTYSVALAESLADGIDIVNQATIVFDSNDAIETPEWSNTIDYSTPESSIEATTSDNINYVLTLIGSDTGSGIWRYDVYSRTSGEYAWQRILTGVEDSHCEYSASSAAIREFMSVAYDRAGNSEVNEISAYIPGDVNIDGKVDATDILLLISNYIGRSVTLSRMAADLNADNRIDAQDVIGVCKKYTDSSIGAKTATQKRRRK